MIEITIKMNNVVRIVKINNDDFRPIEYLKEQSQAYKSTTIGVNEFRIYVNRENTNLR